MDINDELIDEILVHLNNKSKWNGDSLSSFSDNPIELLSIRDELQRLDLIKSMTKSSFILTDFGKQIIDEGGYKKYKSKQIENRNFEEEKQSIEFEKLNFELENAKNTLKSFSETKWIARFAFAIAVLLSLKELYILICK